jgi:hypothetical protein
MRNWAWPCIAAVASAVIYQWHTSPDAFILAIFSPPEAPRCIDLLEKCPEFAATGECTISPKFMRSNCNLSCSVCGTHCIDDNPKCPSYAAGGACFDNPYYMAAHCRQSCGVCTRSRQPHCADNHSFCSDWAKKGDCEGNAGYMVVACNASCGLCGRKLSRCKDTNDECADWVAEGLCDSNPIWMMPRCSLSCGYCATKREPKLGFLLPEGYSHLHPARSRKRNEPRCHRKAAKGKCRVPKVANRCASTCLKPPSMPPGISPTLPLPTQVQGADAGDVAEVVSKASSGDDPALYLDDSKAKQHCDVSCTPIVLRRGTNKDESTSASQTSTS